MDQLSYLQRLKAGICLILGGRIYYTFCNALQAKVTRHREYLGLDHVNSNGIIIVSLDEPKKVEIGELHPVTHIKILPRS